MSLCILTNSKSSLKTIVANRENRDHVRKMFFLASRKTKKRAKGQFCIASIESVDKRTLV